jgi:hypothetical protein
VHLAEDDLMGDLEDAVGQDPQVQQARKIAEAARSRLLACVAGADGDADLTQAQRMMDALRKATILAEDAEDQVRVDAGLLTRDAANRRADARRADARRADARRADARRADARRADAGLADRAVPPGTWPLGRAHATAAPESPLLAVLPKNPALAVLLSLLLPGLGSAVSGNLRTGVTLFGCAALSATGACYAAPPAGRAVASLALAAAWLIGLAAAHRDAREWNRRHGIES